VKNEGMVNRVSVDSRESSMDVSSKLDMALVSSVSYRLCRIALGIGARSAGEGRRRTGTWLCWIKEMSTKREDRYF